MTDFLHYLFAPLIWLVQFVAFAVYQLLPVAVALLVIAIVVGLIVSWMDRRHYGC